MTTRSNASRLISARLGRPGRRAFLRGLGGATVALPWLEAITEGRGVAAAIPKRAIFFMTGQGFVMDNWRPKDASDPTSSEIMKPLAFVKDRVLTIEGVPQSSTFDAKNRAQGHPGGAAGALTGAYAGEGSQYGGCGDCKAGFAVHESIDTAIARHLGPVTRFPSFYVGAKMLDTTVSRRFFYSAPQKPITPEQNPYQVFERVFRDLESGSPNLSLQRRIANRRSVLGAVMEDFKDMRCALGGADRQRLEGHLEKVANIEGRLDISGQASQLCAKPGVPTGIQWDNWDELPKTVAAQIDMAAMMVACDLTRVVGIQIGTPDTNGGYYRFLNIAEEHHWMSHKRGDDPIPRLTRINVWAAEQVARLVKSLQAIPEGNGTAFDNTAILWGAEVGNPWSHDRKGMAWNIIGNGGGHFRTGRHVKFSGSDRDAHNRLLIHFLHMMGSDARTFGVAPYGDGGPLPDLT